MIIGNLEHDDMQILNHRNRYFNKVIDIIKNSNFSIIDDGKYHLEGDSLFYTLLTYKTKKPEENCISESHRKYIDFQYMVYGEERIFYTDYQSIKRYHADYDIEKDVELYSKVSDESMFLIKKDMFVIFYPYEIHRPGISNIEERSVRKAIFKILVKDFV